MRARLVRVVVFGGFRVRPLPLPPFGEAAVESAAVPFFASSSAFRLAASSFAFCRSARFSRISTMVGQSSFRQRFQGRPRKALTFRRGVVSQTEQRSSKRQSS